MAFGSNEELEPIYGNDMHQQLCKLGEKWLRRQGCRVTLRDPFKAAVCTGECPDVIGWRDGHSVLIECKVSRSDFLADKSKMFRAEPALGMGDARLYLAPPGVIQPDDLPEGWGLLIAEGDRVSIASDYPRSYEIGCWSSKPRPKGYRKRIGINWRPLPFTGNKQCETVMLVSALARGMADVGLGVAEHGKKGRVTITFDMERVNDSSQVNVSHKLSYAKPTKRGKASEEDTTATTVYVGSGGKLTLMPDNQPGLFTQSTTEEGVA